MRSLEPARPVRTSHEPSPSPATPQAVAKTGARRHEGQSGRRLQGKPYGPPLIMTAPERTLGTPGGTVIPRALARRRAGHPEAGSRVPVVGVVPVAAAGADVPRIVVPRTAAHHTPAGGRPGFRLTRPARRASPGRTEQTGRSDGANATSRIGRLGPQCPEPDLSSRQTGSPLPRISYNRPCRHHNSARPSCHHFIMIVEWDSKKSLPRLRP